MVGINWIKSLMKKKIWGVTIWSWIRILPLYPLSIIGLVIGLVIVPIWRGIKAANDWMNTL